MYECNEMFLYEIIEDYKDTDSQEEKDELFNSFCSSIWSSNNKRRTYTKAIKYNVKKDLLNTDLGQVFDAWSAVEYKYYKSMTRDETWCSIMRQKLNNIYTRYFDKEVILEKEYLDLIKTPKRLYYEWTSGVDMNAETVTKIIYDAIDNSEKVKIRLQMEKMKLSWNEYKKVVEEFLRRCFENCKLIDEYEDNTKISSHLDFLTEDHFYVGYFCRSLNSYFRNYQKKYYSVRRGHGNQYTRCKQCGSLIEKTNNRVMYCKSCYKKNNQKEAKYRMKKYRNKNVTF